MALFTSREKNALAMICDTLIPALDAQNDEDPDLFRLKAADLNVADRMEETIELVADDETKWLLKLFLNSIENGLFNRATTGIGQTLPFTQLDLDTRTKLLRAWSDSRIPFARRAFQGIKRLAMAIFYSTTRDTPDGKTNPTWAVFNYQVPTNGSTPAPRPIKPLAIIEPTTLYTDALVIGSGAGGGVVAGELSAAGLDVIAAEKGGYYVESDFHGRELDSYHMLYERSGVLTTADLGVTLLAGSTLGGGTTVNWMASLRTPDHVLREWETEYGFTGAASVDYQRSVEAVCKRINVSEDECANNVLNAGLEAGCKALGYDVATVPRNVKNCEDCGFCTFGCPFGAKQSTAKTYLQDAHDRGARILVRAEVKRVLYNNGVAQGAELIVLGEDGSPHAVTIHAKVVVVAAGAVNTPALLLRSGLGNANIGAHFHIHPTTMICSLFDEPVYGWRGSPMTRYSREFANLDGKGYGVWLETAPIHPGLGAQAFAWQSGRQHKRNMQRMDHFSNIIVLNRDAHGGRITIDRHGQPVLHYALSDHDGRHLMHGLIEAMKIHLAAGAKAIFAPHNHIPGYELGANFETFLDSVRSAGFATNAYSLFSAHQMSTCRIGGNSQLGALTPEGESYEVKNLFVADGSVLPTAAGVNPMISIMSAAHWIAQHIKTRF